MKDKLKTIWANVTPRQKRNIVLLAIITAVLAFSMTGYLFKTRDGGTMQGKTAQKKKEITLDAGLLEKSAYLEGRKEIAKTEEKLSLLQKELNEIKEQKAKITQAESKMPLPAVPKPADPSRAVHYPVPPPPPPPAPSTGLSQAGQTSKQAADATGDIEVVSNPQAQKQDQKAAEVKKNEKGDSVYLPPSFMEATLLSGLDAPTVESAKGNPVPVLLRIKDLAILPNKVKADLKGCFVIAEGQGNLADERAHLRLVNLSCLSRKGQAVIDQKIKGFVVDSDGKIGLRGTVVSKMGSAIARSVLAGFFGGVGDALKSGTVTSSISALGTTQTLDSGKIAQAGLGSGLAQGAHDLQKFYLELAKQSMPVIEVGATRNITLVVSEGVDLEIKEKSGGKKQK
jgi:conjugal transfer pilus assembly protein TraB